MTPENVRLVRESWALVRENGFDLSHEFYEHLFRNAPQSRALFAGTSMNAQGRKLVEMLAAIVLVLDDPAALDALIAPMGKRHAEYGVKLRDYPAVGDALMHALQHQLGPALTPKARLAWAEAYDTVSTIMIKAMDPW